MTSNNLDFVARCMIGHNKTAIKSITTELENVQKQIGGVSLVEIAQEDYDTLTDKDPSTIYLVSNGDKITLYIGGAEVNEIEGIKVNNTTINPDSNKVVNITIPTTAADISALPDTTKYAAALSLTINSLTYVMTGQLKDQNGDNLGTAQTIDLPLESVVVGGSYNSQTKKVVLTLQNGNTIEFSVADLVSGLQTELSASNKLNPAYIDYDSTHRAVSDTEKSTWNSKQNAIDSSHKLSADLVDDTNATNKFATAEELEQIQTNKNNILLNGVRICTQWKQTYQAESYKMSMKDFVRDIATGVNMGTYLVHMIAYANGDCGLYLVTYVQPTGDTSVTAIKKLGAISSLTITTGKEIEIPVISSTYGAKVTIYALT